MRFSINGDFQLECPECGSNKFRISLSNTRTCITCIECGLNARYQKGETAVDIDHRNYAPASHFSLDDLPW